MCKWGGCDEQRVQESVLAAAVSAILAGGKEQLGWWQAVGCWQVLQDGSQSAALLPEPNFPLITSGSPNTIIYLVSPNFRPSICSLLGSLNPPTIFSIWASVTSGKVSLDAQTLPSCP